MSTSSSSNGRSAAPIVLHLIDGFGIGGAQQRYFNDLEYLGAPFEHWPCAVFGEVGDGVQGAHLGLPMRTLGARHLRELPLALAALSKQLRATPAIRLVHTQLFSADIIGRVAGRLRGIPVVTTVQSAIYEPDSGLYSGWRHTVDRATVGMTARVVAVSEFVRQSVHRRLGVPLEKIVVIPNTVNTSRIVSDASRRLHARAELQLDDETFAWLNVGRLHAAKGLLGLFNAFAALPASGRDSVLLIAGRGPQHDELVARANALGIASRVRLLGERADVLSLLDACDGFVFPSLSEGLPVSLVEAMAMSKPCVVSAIGPHQECIVDGESGLLVPPRDDQALAAVMGVVQRDAAYASALGTAARRRAEAVFDARHGARALTDLYASLCG